jgi:hypothetical protein
MLIGLCIFKVPQPVMLHCVQFLVYVSVHAKFMQPLRLFLTLVAVAGAITDTKRLPMFA